MGGYIFKRLLLMIPTLLLVTIIVFFMVRLLPTNVIDMMLNEQTRGSSMIGRTELEHRLGFDVPVYVQYVRWLGVVPSADGRFHGVLQGSLGESLWSGTPVLNEIIRRFPVTLELGMMALLFSSIISLPLGIYSAIRQDTGGDYLARIFAIILIALPSFWVATIVIVLPAIWWHWSPPAVFVSLLDNPLKNLGLMVIPAIIMGMHLSGITMRMTRTMMLEVLRNDYIRTAWAKGLQERVIIYRHALKNALMPVVTIIGLQIPVVLSGTVIIEVIFNIPGIGRLLINVINNRDYTTLSGLNLFVATMVLLVNLGVDLIYAYLDPRVRYK
jgi:peptide/nickel transport system permease protein